MRTRFGWVFVGKRSPVRPSVRWKGSINVDLKEIVCEVGGVDGTCPGSCFMEDTSVSDSDR
jgi:hypothetical protein